MSIEVAQATYRYPSEDVAAIEDVSLEVAPAEIVGIVGPNGSGKSTLGRLIKGLRFPSEGKVRVDGHDTRTDTLAVRRLVGMVFQNPNSQIVNSYVEQEVAFGPENLGLPQQVIRDRVHRAIHAVGLDQHEEDECHSLSMPDKQRVAVAAVLALEPRYLILDESTAWIEPNARWPLLQEVLRWAREAGAGLILITHRMEEALVCQRIYGMLDGRVAAQGPPVAVLSNVELRTRLSLELPDSYTLASELLEAGLPVVPGSQIEQLADSLCQF